MHSDLKNWDLYRDPLWILDNLLRRYRIIHLPTTGWGATTSGSGTVTQLVTYLLAGTGTTANSSAVAWREVFGLKTGGARYDVDWDKKLIWRFTLTRQNSDPEAVGRIQIKRTNAEGALADLGLGLEIDNLDLYGEAYGSSRGTVDLGVTMSLARLYEVKIVHVPGVRVEFWVNEKLKGTLTGDHVPSGTAGDSYYVLSMINGPTGGVNAYFQIGNIIIVQER